MVATFNVLSISAVVSRWVPHPTRINNSSSGFIEYTKGCAFGVDDYSVVD